MTRPKRGRTVSSLIEVSRAGCKDCLELAREILWVRLRGDLLEYPESRRDLLEEELFKLEGLIEDRFEELCEPIASKAGVIASWTAFAVASCIGTSTVKGAGMAESFLADFVVLVGGGVASV